MEQSAYNLLCVVISILTLTVAVGGFFLTIFQLKRLRQTREKQYEHLRREKTIEMVLYYIKSIKPENRTAESIVSSLTDAQCQDLYTETPFLINEKVKNSLCELCPVREKCIHYKQNDFDDSKKEIVNESFCTEESNGEYMIGGASLRWLRKMVIHYLNTLETVLLAWQLNIVDQKVLQEQFAFLDKTRHSQRALETFRSIAGNGKSYPAIERFYQYLDEKHRADAQSELKDIIE